MRFPYTVGQARVPQPSLGGGIQRPRPLLAVRVYGSIASSLMDGHLDTGADDTIFPAWIAAVVGLDLSQVKEHPIQLAGRAQPVQSRFLQVQLRISDGVQESYESSAIVGFAAVPLPSVLRCRISRRRPRGDSDSQSLISWASNLRTRKETGPAPFRQRGPGPFRTFRNQPPTSWRIGLPLGSSSMGRPSWARNQVCSGTPRAW